MKKSDIACRAIRAATTESQVIALLRDYMGSLSAAETAVLPAELLTLVLSQTEELVQSALDLMHSKMLTMRDTPDAAVLSDTALVLATAARRLAVLARDTA